MAKALNGVVRLTRLSTASGDHKFLLFIFIAHSALVFFCTRSLSITFRCKTTSKSSIEAKRLLFTKVQVHSPRITISFFLCSELKGAFTVCPKTALQCDRRYLSNNYDEGGFFFRVRLCR